MYIFNKGISLISIIAIIGIIVFLSGIGTKLLINRPSVTTNRANDNFDHLLAGIQGTVLRRSCSHDSDNDGYGSCSATIQYANGAIEKIFAQCPSGLLNNALGGKNCKETQAPLKGNMSIIGSGQ